MEVRKGTTMGPEKEVRQFVIENFMFGQEEESFLNSDSFLDKGLIDSMGILTLVEFVRDKYQIVIEDEELIPEHWDSVERIADFIEGKVRASSPEVTEVAFHTGRG